MPKRNAARLVGPEAYVATRIALERDRRGMSAAELSRRMTAVGCSINQSAINKIEQGDPPRSISTNELVAFAKVFELEVEDLLVPPHLARDQHLSALYARLVTLEMGVSVASQVFLSISAELTRLGALDGTLTSRLAAASDGFTAAFEELSAALAEVSSKVREGLSLLPAEEEPKPSVVGLTFRQPNTYRRRAAEAAAQAPLERPRGEEGSHDK